MNTGQPKWRRVKGVVVKGRGWTSGVGETCPFPHGTVGLQLPCFLQRGLDLSEFYPATLNVSIRPREFSIRNPRLTFRKVTWSAEHPPEDFSFLPCWVTFGDQHVSGFIYYPHPETKVRYFLDNSTLEVITKYLKSIGEGDSLILEFDANELEVT